MVLKAVSSGKHVICEKPLTGYCAPAMDNEGKIVSRAMMYDKVVEQLDKMERALKGYGRQFMYAENFIYAPAVQKTVEFLRAKGSKVLLIKGEESHSGSHAAHAPYWKLNGGGSLIRQGCHPLSAALYIKDQEAAGRGETVRPVAVTAVAGMVTPSLKVRSGLTYRQGPWMWKITPM
jgi:predicted dehydrogenase